MKRVKKGERYWHIDHGMKVTPSTDDRWEFDNNCYRSGNYFTDEASAEAMAKKLRAVLKGADVIEMPAYENVFDAIDKKYQSEYSNGEYCHEQSFSWGFQEGVEWLKSKIVK